MSTLSIELRVEWLQNRLLLILPQLQPPAFIVIRMHFGADYDISYCAFRLVSYKICEAVFNRFAESWQAAHVR